MTLANASLTILDVGHGNSAVIREGSTTLVIDAGGRSDLLEFLQQNDIAKVDLVLISHSDADHIGGLVGLLAAGISIGRVCVNSDSEKTSEAWRDLVVALEDARRRGELEFHVGLSSGAVYIAGFSKCKAWIVAPTPEIIAFGAGSKDRVGRRITSNSISACVRLDYEGKSVALLTGDMDEVSLDSCIDAKTDIKAPILVYPHHGGLSGGPNSANFAKKLMREVAPNRVLFSIGRTRFENPRREVVDIVKISGAYIACTQLSKHCADDTSGLEGNRVPSLYSAGALNGHCCAGTITVDLDAASLFSSHSDHIGFVAKLSSAICK